MANHEKRVNEKTFVEEAYSLENKDSTVDFYKKWADDYDHQMLENLNYLSPTLIAQILVKYLDNRNSRILDMGCGTGLTSMLLHQQGYTDIDGLDFSADMLRVAGERCIYNRLIEADLNKPLSIDDCQYEAAISSGTFTHGHVGAEPLDEIFRILTKGGLLACTIHLDLWQSRGFETKLQQLIDDGSIKCLYREQDCYYEGGEPEGWFCVYQKT
ncbi:MAG: methyltransferase domain-containing protein [Gammaproteobacteria bacterium]|nr:methyltransferase domain-containing protein [Gammaproteobacteria bacterium]